jgi:thiamine phosphate synthase YjbQ (UPF0047 family)
MIVATSRLEIATHEGASLSDVTEDVNEFLRQSGIPVGVCVLEAADRDTCLTLSAELDEDVDDLLRLARSHLAPATLDTGAPEERESTERSDVDPGYTPGGVLSNCLAIPVRATVLALGSWEAVVLLDAQGPASRAIDVTVIGA